jgi:ATP phosphoribosyltransferase regulatory subunit HisZ
VRFQAFVPGAPDAVLAGGRYDDLLARYGRPSPAVGFAIDVEAAAGALEASAERDGAPVRDELTNGAGGVLVTGPLAAASEAADELRRRGKRAVAELSGLSGLELASYAKRWGFSEVVRADAQASGKKKNGRK